jgi:prophage regulatory protein
MGKTMSDENLRIADVMDLLKIRRSSVYEYVKRGILPKPIKLGRTSIWIRSEIDEVIERQKLERDAA